jgi:hypothetical protein
MNPVRALAAVIVTAAVLGLLPGCGSSTATVSGEVTYDGQPVGDGYVTFTPADGKGKDAGGPITGGHYEVTGLPPGPKIVKVIAVKKVNFASSSEEMMRRAAEARKAGDHDGLVDPADTIPANAEGNNAAVELKAGANKHDVHLHKPATKK